MRLLHAADLHVDSPLRGLSAYAGAPVEAIRSATRRALANMVELALAEKADAVLLAGDIFDGDWPDYNTGLYFRSQMSALLAADIEVYLVSGNHDAASQISRRLDLPGVEQLSKTAPDSQYSKRLDLVVHGQGFPVRDVRDNLALGYPDAVPGYFNVGLLHTALSGRDGHDNYAPCKVDDLTAKGYDYWALGHVHTRETVSTDPHIIFPGNIQGRHAREAGPKGCVIVDVAADGAVTPRFEPLDVVRWEHLKVDVSSAADESDAVDLARAALIRAHDEADGRLLAARVSFVGVSEAHDRLWRELETVTAEVRAAANDLDQAWVEKVRPATEAAARDDVSDVADSVNDLRRTARDLRADPDALRRLLEASPLVAKLPAEARSGESGIRPDDGEWRGRLFDEAVDLLVAMVEGGRR